MRREASAFFLIAVIVSAYTTAGLGGAPPPGRASASSGEAAYAAEQAIDGDPTTRWGSEFRDHEWWQYAFDVPQALAGLRIHWETAYGEKYAIQVSNDGKQWRRVFEEDEGDGHTDLVFFRPTRTRYVRMQGLQRGTGWGYSFWEVDFFLEHDAPKATASLSLPGHEAAHVIDGDPSSTWRAQADSPAWVTLTFPDALQLGGVELHWAASYARAYAVDVRSNGANWRTVRTITGANGGRDYLYFPATRADALRVRCLTAHDETEYALKEIKCKGGDEQATPIRHFIAAANDGERGHFPRWLTREQEFWTIVGLPWEDDECLLGETGTVEPYDGGFSVMPMITTGDGASFTWADVTLTQSLARDYLPLPAARWNAERWQLDVAAVPLPGKSSTLVRYRFANRGTKPFAGSLHLLLRPVQLNPQWQYGGLSPIREAQCVRAEPFDYVRVNGEPRMLLLDPPAAVGAAAYTSRDILALSGPLPSKATDTAGKVHVKLRYDLHVPAGAHRDIVVAYPMKRAVRLSSELVADPATTFEKIQNRAARDWSERLGRFDIRIPEKRLVDVLRSNLAYILLNQDGPWIKPGPRNYNRSWIRDGALTSLALLRMGMNRPVARYIRAYAAVLPASGWVPWVIHADGRPTAFVTGTREGHEYDSQGQLAFLVRQYLDFTGDERFARAIYPAVIRALQFAAALRRERMTEAYETAAQLQPYYGILPESNSHEGYYPATHSYWDNFWFLRGLKDGIYLSERLNFPEDAAWLREEEADFRQSLFASIRRVISRDNLDYIPGCVEKGDFDATSTAIAVMACGENGRLPEPYARQTFDRYYEHFLARLRPGGAESFTPYEVRTADAFIRMGQRERALSMLRHFVSDAVRPVGWNHFAEVVHGRRRAPSYIGDMPHTWVGSGYISAVRNLFVYETEERLVLAGGVDAAWTEDGVWVQSLPTRFGPVSYSLQGNTDELRFTAQGDAAPPKGFVLSLPTPFHGMGATANGRPIPAKEGKMTFDRLPIAITFASGGPSVPIPAAAGPP